eukprot:468597_1
MREPPNVFIRYLQYFGLFGSFCILAIYHGVKWIVKRCKADKNEDTKPQASIQAGGGDVVEALLTPFDMNVYMQNINTSNTTLATRSVPSLVIDCADLVNSILWLYYFEYFSGLNIDSIAYKVQLVLSIIKISFDVFQTLIDILTIFKICNVEKILLFLLTQNISMCRFLAVQIMYYYKVFYSFKNLVHMPTFFGLTYEAAACLKSYVGDTYSRGGIDKQIQERINDWGCRCKWVLNKIINKGIIWIWFLLGFVTGNIFLFSWTIVGKKYFLTTMYLYVSIGVFRICSKCIIIAIKDENATKCNANFDYIIKIFLLLVTYINSAICAYGVFTQSQTYYVQYGILPTVYYCLFSLILFGFGFVSCCWQCYGGLDEYKTPEQGNADSKCVVTCCGCMLIVMIILIPLLAVYLGVTDLIFMYGLITLCLLPVVGLMLQFICMSDDDAYDDEFKIEPCSVVCACCICFVFYIIFIVIYVTPSVSFDTFY